MGDNCKCGGELRWCDVCIGWKCEVCDTIAEDYGDDDEDDDYGQPTGSCEECGANLYASECEDFGGLCSSCAWHAEQS